jgi:hypothetical protein
MLEGTEGAESTTRTAGGTPRTPGLRRHFFVKILELVHDYHNDKFLLLRRFPQAMQLLDELRLDSSGVDARKAVLG